MEGLARVQTRIAEIQSRFPAPVRQPIAAASSWAAVAAAAGLDRPPVTAASGASAAAATAATAAAPSDATAVESAVIAKARELLGVPYLWGGTDPSKGLDCSGFTQLVFRSQGVELPRVSSQQATAGSPVASLAEARPGDLLFFDYSPTRPGIDHVGIYLGGGQMVAAPQSGDVVKVQSAGQPTLIRRVLPDPAS